MQLSVGSGGGTGKKKETSSLPSFMNPPSTSKLKKVDSYIAKTSKTPVGKTVTPSKSTSASSSTAYSKMKAIEKASKSVAKPTSTVSSKKTNTVSKKTTSTPKTTNKATVSKTTSTKPVVHASTVKSTSTSKPVATTKKTTSTIKPVSTSSSLDAKKNAYINSLKKSSDAYYNDTVAGLGKQRDEAIKAQQQAYQDAVDQGQISTDEANKQFEADKKAIDQKFYQQAQATNISAYDNGLQNSMQMLGLQAGDNARQQNSVDTATSTRDQQINDIKNRLASLASTRDLNIAGINSDYGYNSAQAKAQSDKMYNDGLATFNANDYSATQNFQNQQTVANQQHTWDVQNANQQHAWDVADANQKHAWDVASATTAYNRSKSLKASTTVAKKPTASVASTIKPIAQAYGQYQATKQNTGLDQYYKSQTALNKGSVVQKNPVLPPVSLANNQTLSPWQKMKIITGG